MWWEFTPSETIKLEKGVPCAMSMDETTKIARVWTGGQQIESSSMPVGSSVVGAAATTTGTSSDPASVVANLTSPMALTAIKAVTGIDVSALSGLFGSLLPLLSGLDPSNLGKAETNLLGGIVTDLASALKAVNPGK